MTRNFPIVGLLAFMVSGLGLAQELHPLVAKQGYADRVLINGKIVTMDDRSIVPNTTGHIVEAMAIKGKKIMALGTNAEMRRLAGPETRTVDVGQKTVIPGLISTHYHLFSDAAANYGPSQGLLDPSVKLTVVSEKTAEGTARKIRDTIVNAIQVQKIPKGQWITVALQENDQNPPRTTGTWLYLGNINRRQIDGGTENHPTIVKMGIYGLFNTAAVEAFKSEFPDWEHSVDWVCHL